MSIAKKTRWGFVLGIIAVIGLALALGVASWRESVTKAREQRETVERLISEGRGAEALALIERRNRAVTKQSESVRQEWLSLEAAALALTTDGPKLLALYEREPKAFASREKATLQLSRALLRVGRVEAFEQLRAQWRGRESLPAQWFELEVDALLLQGKRDEAMALLKGRSFPGAADAGRLTRLGLLHLPGDPKTAADLLDQAVALDPRNPEIHVHRARMFENAGQWPAARLEYLTAFAANTNNPYFRDQLAEFHRRTGQYDQAALTWAGGLTQGNATDGMWLRAIFWTRVARTIPFDWSAHEPPGGPVAPLIRYLLRLPPGTFWDETEFGKLTAHSQYAEHFQEIHWLRLLAALKSGNETAALDLLVSNRFRAQSYHLDLESALLRVLNFRQHGKLQFPAGVGFALNEAPAGARHQLFEQLDAASKPPHRALPADTGRLLRSPDAFAAVFLAAGWAEAALQLQQAEVVPDDYPEWIAFGYTQARRYNRGHGPALDFLARQKQTATLELLAADILMADGLIGDAILKLTPTAKTDSEDGARAARAIAETYLRFKQYDEARAAIEAQPRLERSTGGKELLARIAFHQGNKAAADKIYGAIEDASDEAKDYLAKQAFDQKDFARARQLTEALVQKHPGNPQYRARLETIGKAEAK